jgi:hypothetical protein
MGARGDQEKGNRRRRALRRGRENNVRESPVPWPPYYAGGGPWGHPSGLRDRKESVTLEDRYPIEVPCEHPSGEQAADTRADDGGVPPTVGACKCWCRLVSHTG